MDGKKVVSEKWMCFFGGTKTSEKKNLAKSPMFLGEGIIPIPAKDPCFPAKDPCLDGDGM